MSKPALRKTQRGIWETDTRSLDLTNPRTLKWYVEKKINAGDWQALDRTTLRTILPTLTIDPTLRTLLERFFSLPLRHVSPHPNATRSPVSHRA